MRLASISQEKQAQSPAKECLNITAARARIPGLPKVLIKFEPLWCLQLSEAMQQLSDIITSFEASYEAGEGETGEAEFAPILSAAVDPLVDAMRSSAEALSTTAPTRHAIVLRCKWTLWLAGNKRGLVVS